MSGGILAFEGFNLKSMLKKIKKNPERIFLGAADPASSKMWGKVLGKDYEPVVDQMGGATQQTYKDAEAAGIDTTAGKGMHSIAHVVAAVIAGGYGAGQLGGAGAAGGAGGAGAEGVATAGGGGGLAGLGGTGGSAGAGLSSADAGAIFGNAGYGEGMTGAETSAFDAGLGKGGFSLADLQRWNAAMPQQRQQQAPLHEDDYQEQDIGRYLNGATVASSRGLKDPKRMGLGDALQRGLSGTDPIDTNGVEVVAIKALDRRINDLIKRAQAVARRKGVQA